MNQNQRAFLRNSFAFLLFHLLRVRTTFFLLSIAVILLLGCGFKLRGIEAFAFQRLYIQADPRAPLTLELRRAVRHSQSTQIENDVKKADAILEIISSKRERQVISLNPQGQVREYRLIQQVEFSLRDSQYQFLIFPTELALSRDITYSEAAVLAKEVEEARYYQNMEEDIAQQIIRRLITIKTLTPRQHEIAPSGKTPLLPTK